MSVSFWWDGIGKVTVPDWKAAAALVDRIGEPERTALPCLAVHATPSPVNSEQRDDCGNAIDDIARAYFKMLRRYDPRDKAIDLFQGDMQ